MTTDFSGTRAKTVFDTLRDIAHATRGDKISLGTFSRGLRQRGYGLLLVTLNLPNLIPLPLPFLSIIFGIPLAAVALQMAVGRERPWIPAFLRRRGLKKKEVIYFCDQIDRRYGWIHTLLHPRWPLLTRPTSVRLIGLAISLLAAIMVLPIPFGNLVLAIPITLLALGLLERDGAFVLAGFVLGAAGLSFNLFVGSSILYGLWAAMTRIF